jgi:hypothetical protein
VDAQSWLMAAATLLLSLRWKVSAAWLVVGGGMAGCAISIWQGL